MTQAVTDVSAVYPGGVVPFGARRQRKQTLVRVDVAVDRGDRVDPSAKLTADRSADAVVYEKRVVHLVRIGQIAVISDAKRRRSEQRVGETEVGDQPRELRQYRRLLWRELAVADPRVAADERALLELHAWHHAVAARVALGRIGERVLQRIELHRDGRQRRRAKSYCPDATGRRAIERVLEPRAVEERIRIVLGDGAAAGELERQPLRQPQLDAGQQVVLE